MNRTTILTDIKKAVTAAGDIDKVILFGSRARGNERPDSDWDILVLTRDHQLSMKRQLQIMHQLYLLELAIGEPISTLIYTKEDWETRQLITPLYHAIKTEGIEL